MHGSREAIAGGFSHIEIQVETIERAITENPGLCFDLAKTIVESTCRTILRERSISFNPGDDMPRLFKAVTTTLPMLPAAASSESEARKSLAQTLNGLHTALQGVCELRNAYGFASHGVDGPKPFMESVQALLAAQSADTIVGFLFRMHRQDRVEAAPARLAYGENASFNAYIDDNYENIRIFDEEFQPSRVLFDLAPEAYRIYLAEYIPDAESDEQPMQGAEARGLES
jgi:hypothetical protein